MPLTTNPPATTATTAITPVFANTTASTTAATTEYKSGVDPKAKRVVTPVFMDKLLDASKYWRVGNVHRIVSEWGMKNYYVWYLNERVPIEEIFRKYDAKCSCFNVVVAWNSGPRGQKRIKSHLAHWLVDNIMWEIRLGIDNIDGIKSRVEQLLKLL